MRTVLIDAYGLLFPVIYNSKGYELTTSDGTPVTCIYSFLDDILSLSKELHTNDFIVCFDGGRNLRKELNKAYKANRKEVSDEIKEKREILYKQVPILRDFLTAMGIPCVSVSGYEADDVIASFVYNNPLTQFYTVSGDHDMLQTIRYNNQIYNMSKRNLITEHEFSKMYPGLEAKDYWKVLSLSGCSTDNVPPITKGIGEKTALKYLTGALKPTSKAYKSIEENIQNAPANERLVRLPFEGMPVLKVSEYRSVLSYTGFLQKCEALEFASFFENPEWDAFFNMR